MKQFLRIFVVVLIMIGLGFGTYALFFKPANKEEVYLALAGVPVLEETYSYEASVQSISSVNFKPATSSGYTESIASLYNSVLDTYRPLVNNVGETSLSIEVKNTEGETDYEYKQYSYPQLKLYMDEVFNYYFAYSQAVSRTIPKSRLKEVKSAVSSYETALSNLTNKGFYEVEVLQKYIGENKNQDYSKELGNRYRRVISLYREYITTYANLIDVTKQFVVNYVFSGEMITDRESLLYDLMIDSLVKATSGEYYFDDNTLREVSDDYMNSATKFVELAMASDEEKNNKLKTIYGYDAKTVIYNNTAYSPKSLNYYLIDVKFRVGEVNKNGTKYDALYLENSDIVIADSYNGTVSINDVGVVTINATTASGEKSFSKQSVSGYVSLKCYVNSEDLSKLYFYGGEYGHLVSNQNWLLLSKNAEISGSQVIISDADSLKVSFTYESKIEYYYEINGNFYKINDEQKVVLIGGETKLEAIFYENNFYTNINYGGSGEPLNYKRMIKCYNKIVSEGPEELGKLIELSTEEKLAFVSDGLVNGIRVRASFMEVLHEEMEYLLACCGF